MQASNITAEHLRRAADSVGAAKHAIESGDCAEFRAHVGRAITKLADAIQEDNDEAAFVLHAIARLY